MGLFFFGTANNTLYLHTNIYGLKLEAIKHRNGLSRFTHLHYNIAGIFNNLVGIKEIDTKRKGVKEGGEWGLVVVVHNLCSYATMCCMVLVLVLVLSSLLLSLLLAPAWRSGESEKRRESGRIHGMPLGCCGNCFLFQRGTNGEFTW